MRYRVAAIIIAGFSTIFVAFGIRYSYGVLLPEMLASLAISKTEAGVVYASYFFICTLSSPVLGLLADRTDARTLLTLFVALLGISACLMSTASSVFQASIFFALAGLGHAACWAPMVTVVMRWVSEKRRGIALSFVDLGSASSITFWGLMIPLIIGPFGWRAVWMLLGLFALLSAVMNFFFIRNKPPNPSQPQMPETTQKPKTSIKAAYRAIFSDGKFHLIGCSYLLISFSILIPFTFLTAYGTQELHIPYQSAAVLVAVIGIAGAGGKLVLGYISDLVGRLRIIMFCGVLTAAGGLGLAYLHDFQLLVIATVIFGIGYGTIWPQYAAVARDMFSAEYSGSVIGLWTLYHGMGSVLSPVVAGWSIDATGSYFWAFMLTVVSAILSLLLLLPLVNKTAGALLQRHH